MKEEQINKLMEQNQEIIEASDTIIILCCVILGWAISETFSKFF